MFTQAVKTKPVLEFEQEVEEFKLKATRFKVEVHTKVLECIKELIVQDKVVADIKQAVDR